MCACLSLYSLENNWLLFSDTSSIFKPLPHLPNQLLVKSTYCQNSFFFITIYGQCDQWCMWMLPVGFVVKDKPLINYHVVIIDVGICCPWRNYHGKHACWWKGVHRLAFLVSCSSIQNHIEILLNSILDKSLILYQEINFNLRQP